MERDILVESLKIFEEEGIGFREYSRTKAATADS